MNNLPHKARWRLCIAAKDEEEQKPKNLRRINAMIQNALADLDDVLLANNLNEAPEGLFNKAYNAIHSWATNSIEELEDEEQALDLAKTIRSMVSKSKKSLTRLAKLNSQYSEIEEGLGSVFSEFGLDLDLKGEAYKKTEKE